jgi:hypothetical protein
VAFSMFSLTLSRDWLFPGDIFEDRGTPFYQMFLSLEDHTGINEMLVASTTYCSGKYADVHERTQYQSLANNSCCFINVRYPIAR